MSRKSGIIIISVTALVCAAIIAYFIIISGGKSPKTEQSTEIATVELDIPSPAESSTSETGEEESESVLPESGDNGITVIANSGDDEPGEDETEESDDKADGAQNDGTDEGQNPEDPGTAAVSEGDLEHVPAGTIIDISTVDSSRIDDYFKAYTISDEIYGIINGKSFQENTEVSRDDLRYVKVLHYNFEHRVQVGELIVAASLADDYTAIFKELFNAEYEIQSMYLPDKYWTGDGTSTDSASIDANNSSSFLYRPATGSGKLSKHSYGRAIDINPQQNPYVSYSSGSPEWSHSNADAYIDRTTGLPHVITEEDTCYKIFTAHGFTWGGSWKNPKDYQHFQK